MRAPAQPSSVASSNEPMVAAAMMVALLCRCSAPATLSLMPLSSCCSPDMVSPVVVLFLLLLLPRPRRTRRVEWWGYRCTRVASACTCSGLSSCAANSSLFGSPEPVAGARADRESRHVSTPAVLPSAWAEQGPAQVNLTSQSFTELQHSKQEKQRDHCPAGNCVDQLHPANERLQKLMSKPGIMNLQVDDGSVEFSNVTTVTKYRGSRKPRPHGVPVPSMPATSSC